jgi:hypothetical protein
MEGRKNVCLGHFIYNDLVGLAELEEEEREESGAVILGYILDWLSLSDHFDEPLVPLSFSSQQPIITITNTSIFRTYFLNTNRESSGCLLISRIAFFLSFNTKLTNRQIVPCNAI